MDIKRTNAQHLPPDIDCADVEDDPNQEAEERSRPQMHIYTLKHTAGFETHTHTH